MIVYCRFHGDVMGVVERHPVGGFPQLKYRGPRMRAHHMAAARHEGHDSAFQRLDNRSRPTLEAGGCERCGLREVQIKELRAAFEAGLPKIRV